MSHSPWFQRQPTLLPGRPISPERAYTLRAVAGGFFMWMAFALYALYAVREAGLTPYQLIAVAVVLEATVVLFEIPTGVLSDLVSRRLSVIAGTLISGAAWMVIGAFPTFEGVALGQFLWGFGFTFSSGANEAWLADEIGEDAAAAVYPRAAQWRQVARVLGVLAGTGLGLLHASAPWLVGGTGHVALGVVLLFTMTEAGWQPAARNGASALARMRHVGVVGVAAARRRPMVRAAMGVAFLVGASSEMLWSLWGYHLIEGIGIPGAVHEVLLFGGISVAAELGALGMIAVGRRASADGTRAAAARVLMGLYLAAVACALAFALAPVAAVAAVLIIGTQSMYHAEGPFFMMWLNRGLEPGTRATVLSSVNQMNSVGQVAQGPLAAGIVRFGAVRASLAVGALVLLPAVALLRTRPLEEGAALEGEAVVARVRREPA